MGSFLDSCPFRSTVTFMLIVWPQLWPTWLHTVQYNDQSASSLLSCDSLQRLSHPQRLNLFIYPRKHRCLHESHRPAPDLSFPRTYFSNMAGSRSKHVPGIRSRHTDAYSSPALRNKYCVTDTQEILRKINRMISVNQCSLIFSWTSVQYSA